MKRSIKDIWQGWREELALGSFMFIVNFPFIWIPVLLYFVFT
jgi:hypothetical protein